MDLSWVGSVVGVIVGFTLNIAYQLFREARSRPVLKIDCTRAKRRIGDVPTDRYMKFRVRNKRPRTTARNCRAYLIGIHEVRGTEVMAENLMPDTVQLPWERGDFDPRDIPSGHSQYGDIVHFSKREGEKGWVFTTNPNYIKSEEYTKSKYQFIILVAGDGVEPAKGAINITYTGDPDTAEPLDA